jgi:RNA polymerase sigma factor (sigma-70 family)
MSGRSRSDEALVAAFRAGDEHAFEAIDARYRARLTAYARRILKNADPGLAEDVVQESLWRAHRALRRDDRPMQLRAWLHRLVRNCSLDELSRIRLAVDLTESAVVADPRDEPSRAAERKADLRQLLDDLATLPPTQRHVLVRREIDGASHAQLAAELGISTKATRGLVHRARMGLARAAAGRSAGCGEVRAELLAAHDERRRLSAGGLRHLAVCPSCRALRTALRRQRRAVAVLVPPPLLFGGVAALKLALVGKASVGKTATVVAIGATVATGAGLGVRVFEAGDPTPVALRSIALPHGRLASGAALPRGVAVVQRTVAADAGPLTLRCPADLRAVDVLPPRGARVTVTYAPAAVPGADAAARLVLRPAPGASGRRVVLAVLCRRADASGSVVAAPALGRGPNAVVAQRSLLRRQPSRHATMGSVRPGQPVDVVAAAANGRWLRVRADDGQRGWLRSTAVR